MSNATTTLNGLVRLNITDCEHGRPGNHMLINIDDDDILSLTSRAGYIYVYTTSDHGVRVQLDSPNHSLLVGWLNTLGLVGLNIMHSEHEESYSDHMTITDTDGDILSLSVSGGYIYVYTESPLGVRIRLDSPNHGRLVGWLNSLGFVKLNSKE